MKIAVLMVTLVFLTSPGWAAKDNREKQMLRRVQQQAQRAEQARAQAEQEKASLLAEKETLARQFQQTQSEADAAKRQTGAVRADKTRLERELSALRVELGEVKKQLEANSKQLSDSELLQRTTAQKLALTESGKKETESELLQKGKKLQVCSEHNDRMYQMGRELITKYEQKSCKDAVLQNEPFTGLKKVEMENLFEQWRDSLDRERLGKEMQAPESARGSPGLSQ